jgi:DNA-directed RNA polymerase specialized sigma24 family protein
MQLPFRKEDKKQNTVRDAPGAELDRELAEGLGKGDRKALARWLDRHLTALHRYLTRRLGPGHEELVEEVVRLTLEEGIRRMKPYARGKASLPMHLWLLRLANRHLARNKIRSRIKATPNGEGVESVGLEHLRKVMIDMPPRHQAVVALALFEGMAPEDVGAAAGISPARAMRRLRDALKRIDQDDARLEDSLEYS